MTATIIDGKQISRDIQQEIKQQVADFVGAGNAAPKLVAVLVGEDPASQVYVKNKKLACKRVGIDSDLMRIDGSSTTEDLLKLVDQLNSDASVSGILVQLPLPDQIDSLKVLDAISPTKDVDAFLSLIHI